MDRREKTPEVSVIVPIYNAEKTLAECVDSLLAQTLENIEIILVNDGSQDASEAICEAYAARDPRVFVLHQENQGAGAARNAGLALARGEYLAFQDADDRYCPQALEAALDRARSARADVVIFDAVLIDPQGVPLGEERIRASAALGMETFSARDIPRRLFQTATSNPWSKLFRRAFIAECGLRFQTLKTANDLRFVYGSMARAERIAALAQPLAQHRVLHADNLQTLKRKSPMDFALALEGLREDLAAWGLWTALEQSFANMAAAQCLHNLNTLDEEGRARLFSERERLISLAELNRRPPEDYYDRDGYRRLCHWLLRGKKRKGVMSGLKGFLKKFLPPPVDAFNREIGALRELVQEQGEALAAAERKRAEEERLLLQELVKRQEETVRLQREILERQKQSPGEKNEAQ